MVAGFEVRSLGRFAVGFWAAWQVGSGLRLLVGSSLTPKRVPIE